MTTTPTSGESRPATEREVNRDSGGAWAEVRPLEDFATSARSLAGDGTFREGYLAGWNDAKADRQYGEGRHVVKGCAKCGWPTMPLRTPEDDCPLFDDPSHDSLNCPDCWGICDELCDGCGRPVRVQKLDGPPTEDDNGWEPCAMCGGSGGRFDATFIEGGCTFCGGRGATADV